MAPKKKSPAPTPGKKKTLSFDESAMKEASAAVETVRAGHQVRKGVSFATPAGGAAVSRNNNKKKGSGIVEAKSVSSAAGSRKRPRGTSSAGDAEADEEHHHHTSAALVEEEDDANSLVDSSGDDGAEAGEDNLSDLADAESNDDSDDDENPFVRAHKTGTRLAYPAVRLSYLPQEFQEPQLFKFLDQFGAKVLNCFCVRSRRTHQSKGVAYVQFDRESVLPLVIEECHGMSLGGRSIQARKVVLHRPMPTKEKVARRCKLAYAYATKGAPLKHHNVTHKSPVALVIGAAKTEAQNNAHLKRLGIPYETHFFTSQIERIPKELLTKKVRGVGQAPVSATASTSTTSSTARGKKAAKVESSASKSSSPAATIRSPAPARASASPAKSASPAGAKSSPRKAATPRRTSTAKK